MKRRLYSLLALVAMIAMTAVAGTLALNKWAAMNDEQGDTEATVVTSLDQLTGRGVYTIASERCFLLTSESHEGLYTSTATDFAAPAQDDTDAAQQFAILKTDVGYYLYSVGKKQFVHGAVETLTDTPTQLTIAENGTSDYRWLFSFGVKYINTQEAQQFSHGVVINTWSAADPGNRLCIKEVAEISQEDYDYAMTCIAAEEGWVYGGEIKPVEAIHLPETLNLGGGETALLKLTFSPVGSSAEVTWASSDESVVTVENGNVTACTTKGVHHATVTATCGEFTAQCEVTVDSYGFSLSNGSEPNGQRYLTSVVTTGATTNLAYATDTYCGASHYQDALEHKLVVKPGQEVVLTFAGPEVADGIRYTKGKAWADWNADGAFDEEGEVAFEFGASQDATGDFETGHECTFTIPENATAGEGRLRMVFADAWDAGQATVHAKGLTEKGFTIDFALEIAEVPTQPEVEGDALEYVYFKQGGKYLGITAISGNNGVNKVDEPQTWQVIPQTDGSVRLKDLEGANISGQNYLYDGSTFSINDLTANPISKLDMQLYLIDTATGIGYPVSELHAGSTYAIYGKNLNKALDNTIVSKGSGSGQYNYFNGVAPTTQGENKVFPETTWWTVEAGVEPAPAEPTPEYYVFNEYTFKYLGTDENNVNVLDEPANVAFAANEENHTVTMDFVNPTNATQHGMHIGSGCRFSVGTAADAQFYIYEIGEEGIGTLVETVEAGKTYGFVAKKSNTEIAALTSNVYSAGNSSQRLEGEILEETDGFPATTMMFSAAAQWTVYATDATLPEPPSFPETVYNVVTNRKTGKLLVANTETNTLELTDDATAATKFGVEWTYAEGRNHSYLRTEAGKYVALVEAGEGYAFTLSDTPAEASVLEESETRFVVYFPVSEYIEMLLGVADDAVVATDDWDGAIYWAWGEYVATPTTPPTVATVDPEEGEVESLDHIRLTFDELAFDLYQNLDDMTLRPVLTRNGEVVPTHSNFNNPPVWVEGAEGEEGYWNYDSDAAEEGVYHVVLREATTAPGTYVLTIPAGAVVYYDDDAEEVGNEEVSFTWTIAGDEPVVADYSTNWDGQNADHASRYTTAVGITTASNDAQQTTSTLQPRDFQALVWNLADADEPMVFTAQQNEMITPFFNFNGEWMNGYVWVDEDGDGFSCVADNETHTITGDLKSYNFYSFSDSDESGYNSLGEAVTDNARNCLTSSKHGAPAFAAPAQVGDYRIRFIVDWNCIDPKGAPEGYATGSTKSNGGIIVDAILRVSPVTGINAATIDFENQKVFDLQGRRVLKPAHGVFIVNGKKVMVK